MKYKMKRKYKMKSYCLKCRKDTENINPKVSGTSNSKAMTLSNCAISSSKISRFIKNQEAKGLLSNLGLRTPSTLANIRWYFVFSTVPLNAISLEYKINETENKFY